MIKCCIVPVLLELFSGHTHTRGPSWYASGWEGEVVPTGPVFSASCGPAGLGRSLAGPLGRCDPLAESNREPLPTVRVCGSSRGW